MPREFWEPNPDPLQEQQVLSNMEPLLQPLRISLQPPLTQEAYKSLVKLCLGFVANFREDEFQFLWHKRRWGEKKGKGGQKDSAISRTFQCLSFQTMLRAETPHTGVSQHFSITHIWSWWYKIRLRASISIHHLNEPKDMGFIIIAFCTLACH